MMRETCVYPKVIIIAFFKALHVQEILNILHVNCKYIVNLIVVGRLGEKITKSRKIFISFTLQILICANECQQDGYFILNLKKIFKRNV